MHAHELAGIARRRRLNGREGNLLHAFDLGSHLGLVLVVVDDGSGTTAKNDDEDQRRRSWHSRAVARSAAAIGARNQTTKSLRRCARTKRSERARLEESCLTGEGESSMSSHGGGEDPATVELE